MKSVFSFESYDLDLKKGVATFHYLLEVHGTQTRFTDTLTFEHVPRGAWQKSVELMVPILDALHVVLGISYWKLYCSKTITIQNRVLSKQEAAFWNLVYTKGLGEFFYTNKLNPKNLVQFPFDAHTRAPRVLPRHRVPQRALLLVGGGKDSIVSAELLRNAGKSFTPFILNNSKIQSDVLRVMDSHAIMVRHELDKKLFTLNKRNDTYNGHIPVSAMYAFVGACAAALYGYRFVIASNERSANYGNVVYRGSMVNHQWSKSAEFEAALQKYMALFVSPDIAYFSLLRPLSEIKITELFSRHKKYFSAFSSCNRNFKIAGARTHARWCCTCSKCAFVFAALAAFLPKHDVIQMFGKDLFADRALLATYEELLGVKRIKPFECVGTPEETIYAFLKIHERGEFEDTFAMRMFVKRVLPKVRSVHALERRVMKQLQRHRVPKEFASVITHI